MNPRLEIDLRDETGGDGPFLADLHRGAILQAMGAPGACTDPVWDRLADLQLRARILGHATDWPEARRRTAWSGDERVGALVTSLQPDSLHVVDIAVAVASRRRGVGRAMLAAVLREADRAGVETTARILASNAASLALFSAAGFRFEEPVDVIQIPARRLPITNM